MNPLEKRSRKTQLKTLKDLEKKYSVNRTGCDGDEEIDMNVWEWNNKLRDAAREWINLLEKDLAKLDKEIDDYQNQDGSKCGDYVIGQCMNNHEIIAKIVWIKHFFNLEDE